MAGLAQKRMIENEENHEIQDVQDVQENQDEQGELNSRPEELRLIEAMLFASKEPLDEKTLASRLPEGANLRDALDMLKAEYLPRGVNLVRINGKWTFRTATDLAWLLTKEAGRNRGCARCCDLQGHARRLAGNRLGAAARPSQGAGPSDHLRHDGGFRLAFRS